MSRRGRGIGPSVDAVAQYARERVCGRLIPRELSTDIEGGRYPPTTTCVRPVGHLDSDPGPSGAAHYHQGPKGHPLWSEADCNGDIAAMSPLL